MACPPPLKKWNTYYGGIECGGRANSYDVVTNGGKYSIQPICPRGRLRGYRLYFINDKGKKSGGLWQDQGTFARASSAARVARDHCEINSLAGLSKVKKKRRRRRKR